ncbi:holin [Corynebacterium cystitidis]|uniref:holin n=1 Tax=Corynebacterium cystitidis TaxID=35757 RepID=UPI00211E61D7|nr:holin [Corynebacterium cystitidis]
MRSKDFWVDTAERAIKTFAQTLVAGLAVGTAIWDLPWIEMLGIALTATAVSVLTSIGSGQVGDHESASLAAPAKPDHGGHQAAGAPRAAGGPGAQS